MVKIPVLDLLSKAADKIWPDKEKAMEFKLKCQELDQQGEFKTLDADLQIALAQIAINKEDAKSSSGFQKNWRPAVAWVCVFSFAYPVMTNMFSWFIQLCAFFLKADLTGFPMPPEIDIAVYVSVLGGLLGFGGLRSLDHHLRRKQLSKLPEIEVSHER